MAQNHPARRYMTIPINVAPDDCEDLTEALEAARDHIEDALALIGHDDVSLDNVDWDHGQYVLWFSTEDPLIAEQYGFDR